MSLLWMSDQILNLTMEVGLAKTAAEGAKPGD